MESCRIFSGRRATLENRHVLLWGNDYCTLCTRMGGRGYIQSVELSNLLVFLSQSYPMLVTSATVRASYTCILCIAF